MLQPITIDLIIKKWDPLIESFFKYQRDSTIEIQEIELEHIGVLIRGKHLMKALPSVNKYVIYELLRSARVVFTSGFRKIFDYDFTKYPMSYMLERNLDPFDVTPAELGEPPPEEE